MNQTFKKYIAKEDVKQEPSISYTLKQNSKAKYFKYTLMSLICSILLAMYLSKTLQDKLIKTVAYFKNQSLGINGIIPYKLGNYMQSNLSYLKVVGSYAQVCISKEKRVKLDVYSQKEIFIGYEDKNQYWVYNPCTRKVYITQNLFVNEQHLYH